MTYMKITGPRPSIEVPDHKNLIAAWRLYGHTPLVGRFTVRKPLTASQLRRLPVELRDRLQ
jgi:hypothetical protein